jgi:WD40 repeat protein
MSAHNHYPVRRFLFLLFILTPVISACLFFELPGADATPQPSVEISSTQELTTPTTTTAPLPRPTWLYPEIMLSNASRISQVNQFGRGRLMDLGWSAGSDRLVLGSYTGLDVYDAGSMALTHHLATPAYVEALAVSPVGNLAAAGLGNGQVQVWDIAAGGQPHDAYEWAASAVELMFSNDGKLLASGSLDDEVTIWDTASGEEKAAFTGDTGRVTSLAFSPDGSILAIASVAQQSGPIVATIYFRDTQTGTLLGSVRDFGDMVFEMAFSTDGKNLFVIGSAGGVTRIDANNRHSGYRFLNLISNRSTKPPSFRTGPPSPCALIRGMWRFGI